MHAETTFTPLPAAPRKPVLGWSSLRHATVRTLPDLERWPHKLFVTSGRAAIYQALRQLRAAPGSTVLVPTYHCPSIIVPGMLQGLPPRFYGVGRDGLPLLDTIDADSAQRSVAIVVPHYFGLARPLHAVRAWCDAHGVALIEDCAHCFFGNDVGSWGDFATGSLSKFFPVPEGGLLVSARRRITAPPLQPQGWTAEIKDVVDVLEHASAHSALPGLNGVLRLLFGLKNRVRRAPRAAAAAVTAPQPSPQDDVQRLMREYCDMSRVAQAPLRVSMVLQSSLPRSRIIERRQAHFERYARHFAPTAGSPGARPLFEAMAVDAAAPYVFPLWVDDVERVYDIVRRQGLPVLRWDRVWPGMPELPGDQGVTWSRHVLQLLCHQDLDTDTIDRTAAILLQAVSAAQGAVA